MHRVVCVVCPVSHQVHRPFLALCAFLSQAELLKTINEYDVTVVQGGTGSGKSTQVPQFILDELLGSGP